MTSLVHTSNSLYLRLLCRNIRSQSYINQKASRCFSDHGKDNDDKTNNGAKKLENLLESLKVIKNVSETHSHSSMRLDLAMPKNQRTKKPKPQKIEDSSDHEELSSKLDDGIVEAVKDVAESLNNKETETELLAKLEAHKKETEEAKVKGMQLLDLVTHMKIDQSKGMGSDKTEKIVNNWAAKAKNERRQRKNTRTNQESNENEAVQSSDTMQSFQANETSVKKPTIQISDMFLGMKIDRSKKVEKQPIKRFEKNLQIRDRLGRVDIFGDAEPLNIFQLESSGEQKKSTWNDLLERELAITVMHPSKNPYEEMIRWTEQGKLWKFPIDNEYGLTDDVDVGFHEHIFIQTELEHGFPKSGPIRVFMELVCIGLSKNPYISLERKKEHIEWFRIYFKKKEGLLKAADVEVVSN